LSKVSGRIANYLRQLVYPFWLLDAKKKYRWIKASLTIDDVILEIGSGMGSVIHVLRQQGHQVVGVDVRDTSVKSDLAPTIYAGQQLPYPDQSFDVCLLLTVLHHCHNPDQVLSEAARVAKRVIVIEDIYNNRWQKRLTYCLDSLLNWEFFGHPHNNRSDAEWRNSFQKLGIQLIHASKHPVALVFCQVTYVLNRFKGDQL